MRRALQHRSPYMTNCLEIPPASQGALQTLVPGALGRWRARSSKRRTYRRALSPETSHDAKSIVGLEPGRDVLL